MVTGMPDAYTDVPRDDHRYYTFPYLQVFEGALVTLERMGMRVRYSNAHQGRIIAHRVSAAGGFLDIKLIGQRAVTFVHVRVGSSTVSRRDDTRELRRRFFWDLSEWLHNATPNQLLGVHRNTERARGRPTRAWVPPQAAYKIDHAHPNEDPRGTRLLRTTHRDGSGWAVGPPRASPPG